MQPSYGRIAATLVACICASEGARASVTIYGLADVCFARVDRANSKDLALNSGCSTGSRFGMRGSEDLGGGLRAAFTLESGFNIDDGALGQGGRTFGRKALVSIGSQRHGTIELGRDYGPAFYLVSPADPMSTGFGTAGTMISTGANPTTVARNDNAINYLSPAEWGPWSIRMQYSFGEQPAPAASRGRDTAGFNVIYRDGPWRAGASYSRHRNAADTGADTAKTVAVSREVGDVTLTAIGQTGQFRGSRTAAVPSNPTGAFSLDYRSWLLGATVRTGGSTRIAMSYKRYDDHTRSNFDAAQWTVLGFYALSKRTELYAGYSNLNNNTGAGLSIADATTTYTVGKPGATTSVMVAGMRHSF